MTPESALAALNVYAKTIGLVITSAGNVAAIKKAKGPYDSTVYMTWAGLKAAIDEDRLADDYARMWARISGYGRSRA